MPAPLPVRKPLRLAAAALCLCAAACSVDVPVLLPPPFGPDGRTSPTIFFPTGLARTPAGGLLVANSNLDRTYDSGALISLRKEWLDAIFAAPADPLFVTQSLPVDAVAGCDQPKTSCAGAAMVPDYAGPVALDQTGTVAWVSSRTTNLVTAVRLDPSTGALTCFSGPGQDCRAGTLDTLASVGLEGPYGLAAGTARPPGDVDQQVMFVSSLVPHITSIENGAAQTYGRLTALPIGAPATPLFTVDASSPLVVAGIGAGPILYDSKRRQVILGGCYQRVSGSLAGDPATSKCSTLTGLNPIRFIDVDSGKDAVVRIFDLTATVHGNETTALVLGGEDASGVPQILYAVSRNPDVLVEIELPPAPGQDPFVRRATPLPLSPSGAVRLERPPEHPGPDLIAVVGSSNGTVSIYDASAGQVVAQVNGLGDFPFLLAQLDPAGDQARLVATVFGNCRLAFLDVDYDEPWNARLRGLVGTCPQ